MMQTNSSTTLESASPFDLSRIDKEYPDLRGQVWVVTGPPTGIAFEVAKRLAAKRAKVWLVWGSKDELKRCIGLIKTSVFRANVNYVVADYSDLRTVAPALGKMLHVERKLNGVIHNGTDSSAHKGEKTKQGYDYDVGVNSLAPQLVQTLLDPLLLRTAAITQGKEPSRIVWISSADSPSTTSTSADVAVNFVQSVQWAYNHKQNYVVSVAVHPSILCTDLDTDVGCATPTRMAWPPEYAAYTELYAALDPDVHSGMYIQPLGHANKVAPELLAAAADGRGRATYDWIHTRIQRYIY